MTFLLVKLCVSLQCIIVLKNKNPSLPFHNLICHRPHPTVPLVDFFGTFIYLCKIDRVCMNVCVFLWVSVFKRERYKEKGAREREKQIEREWHSKNFKKLFSTNSEHFFNQIKKLPKIIHDLILYLLKYHLTLIRYLQVSVI